MTVSLRRFALPALVLLLAASMPSGPVSAEDAASAPAPAFDSAHRLQGSLRYQIVVDGSVHGSVDISGRIDRGTYQLHDISQMEIPPGEDGTGGQSIYEELVLRLDPEDLSPYSVWVSGQFGAASIRIVLDRIEDRLRGFSVVRRGPDQPWEERPLDLAWPDGAWMRGAILYGAQGFGLEPGDAVQATWFGVLGGVFQDVRLVADDELSEITVPAGTFQALRVEQIGGTPGNVLWISRETPRRVVRFEVVGQPMVIDLLPASDEADEAGEADDE